MHKELWPCLDGAHSVAPCNMRILKPSHKLLLVIKMYIFAQPSFTVLFFCLYFVLKYMFLLCFGFLTVMTVTFG